MLAFNIVLVLLVIISEGFLLGGLIASKGKNPLPYIIGPLIFIMSFLFMFNEVKQTTNNITVELGDEISTNPKDYLKGVPFVVKNSKVNLESVDETRTGVYTMVIKHFVQTFEVNVKIQDTTPPELVLVEGPVYIEKDTDYDVANLVAKTYDISGKVDLAYLDEYKFNKCGEMEVQVVATDRNRNETVRAFTVVVDTAPEITIGKEFYLAVGSNTDLMEFVTARDDVDGNLTSRIELDRDAVKVNEAGNYKVTYTVMDNYGLSTEVETTVRVMNKNDLQNKINNHEINRVEDKIVGAINPYDGGVYKNKTIDEIADCIKTSIVCVFYPKPNGGWSRGSGFILAMDEKQIVICTNYHVVKGEKEAEIHFFNNTTAPGVTLDEGELVCSENDLALVTVQCKDVDPKTLEQLTTIHINKGYYDSLGKTQEIELELRSMDQNGKYWFDESGALVDKSTTYPNDADKLKYGYLTQISIRLKPGVSGSAVVDKNGNLICMAVAHYNSGASQTNYAIKLDRILEMYEKNFNKKAYYE